MNEQTRNIIDKVEKLLTLADRTSSEGESRAAAKAAERIMRKYDIAPDDLHKSNLSRRTVSTGYVQTPGDMKLLATVLGDFLGVYVLYGGPRVGRDRCRSFTVYGLNTDLDAFDYAYTRLQREILRMVKDKDGLGRRGSHDYRHGLVAGLRQRLASIVENVSRHRAATQALVHNPSAAKQEAAEGFALEREGSVGTQTVSHRASASYRAGVTDAQHIRVDPAVKNGKRSKGQIGS